MKGDLDCMFEELNLPFARNEIVNVCKQKNNGKAAGPDHMMSDFLKYGIHSNKFKVRYVHSLTNPFCRGLL